MKSGVSYPVLLCLCAVCYLVGRLSVPGTTIKLPTKLARRAAAEVQQPDDKLASADTTLVPASVSTPPIKGNYTSFEALVAESGMLADRPIIPAGESGYNFYVVQPFQMLSWYPRIYVYPKFMDAARAQHVVELASRRLVKSAVALRNGDTFEGTKDVRTSSGTFVTRDDDPDGVLAWVEEKIAQLVGIPVHHGEAFNVLRYDLEQHYESHYDVFDPESYGPQPSQRAATVLFYLSDVEEGGETVFPLEGKQGLDRLQTIDYKACDIGITYKPRMGDAVLFWSVNPDDSFTKHALHGGCPVFKGTKWVMTKWIRDKSFSGE